MSTGYIDIEECFLPLPPGNRSRRTKLNRLLPGLSLGALRAVAEAAAPMMTYPARLTVIIGPQCSWNNHPWVLRMRRMSERYRRLLRQGCCCRASRLAGARLQLLAHH